MLATSSARLRPLKSDQQLAKDSQVTGNCDLHQVDSESCSTPRSSRLKLHNSKM